MTKALLAGATLVLAGAATLAAAQVPAPPPPGWTGPASVATRADVAARIRTAFARFDRNHDGALTPDELPSDGAMRGDGNPHPGGPQARPQGMPGQFDSAQRPGGGPAEAFDRLDRDHNGVITRDEFAGADMVTRVIRIERGQGGEQGGERGMGMGRPMGGGMGRGMGMGGGMGAGGMFAMADANHDGRVTLTEATDTALRHFDQIDRNRDGRITPDERQGGRARPNNGG